MGLRKLAFTSDEAGLHYQAARTAITEAGLTKDFKQKKVVRSVAFIERADFDQIPITYSIWYAGLLEAVRCTTQTSRSCFDFTFEWPELKMRSVAQRYHHDDVPSSEE